jgi:hypothetical protein
MPKYIIDFIYKGGRSLDGFSENGMTLSVYRVGRRCAGGRSLTKVGEVGDMNEEIIWPDKIIAEKADYLIGRHQNLGTYWIPNQTFNQFEPHPTYPRYLTDWAKVHCKVLNPLRKED